MHDDDPDTWWATLGAERKASIKRWLTGAKPPPSPEELGLLPMIREDGEVVDEAKPMMR
jgi:hypothetical protein